MRIGKVVGTATSSVKDPPLTGQSLLVVEPVDAAGESIGPQEVAVDTVGAGSGDWVLVAYGSAARQPGKARGAPADAAVVAILEELKVGDQITYRSGS
jgi:microcompartment protein CcmK/EutM